MISTSRFSKDAHDFVAGIEKRIVLIDGEKLADLMIELNDPEDVRPAHVPVNVPAHVLRNVQISVRITEDRLMWLGVRPKTGEWRLIGG